MNSVLKEVISMSLIAIAMVIILILVFYDYLNIEYCGVKAPASYISPKDIVLYSISLYTRKKKS